MPWRCSRSARFTAVAVTRMRTSAGRAAGRAPRPVTRTSSSPGSRITMARIPVANHDPRLMATCGGVCIIAAHVDPGSGSFSSRGSPPAVVVAPRPDARARVEGERAAARASASSSAALEDAEAGLQVTRSHLRRRRRAARRPSGAAIISGKAWRDVQPAPALVMWQQTPELFVLDVRTEAEWANGHIPRAHLVPVDELEDRLRELPPKDARIARPLRRRRPEPAGVSDPRRPRLHAAHEPRRRHARVAGAARAGRGAVHAAAPRRTCRRGRRSTTAAAPISEAQVVGAIRECFDPEIPLNIYDLGPRLRHRHRARGDRGEDDARRRRPARRPARSRST